MSDENNTQVTEFTLGQAISIEEQKRYFAQHNPIDKEFWSKMSDISILGATLYTLGIDPDALSVHQHHYGEPASTDEELPDGFLARLNIIKSAVRVGSIQRVGVSDNKPSEIADATRIVKDSFLDWCSDQEYTCEATETEPEDSTGAKQQNEKDESTHDPLPLDGIALMFKVEIDDAKNILCWRKFAKNAERNKLATARTKKNKGKAQSIFDPVKVGDWLVAKGKIDQSRVNIILANNYPPRSAHLKDI